MLLRSFCVSRVLRRPSAEARRLLRCGGAQNLDAFLEARGVPYLKRIVGGAAARVQQRFPRRQPNPNGRAAARVLPAPLGPRARLARPAPR
jgi:hypothetical protein